MSNARPIETPIAGLILGVFVFALATFTIGFQSDAGRSAPLPAGFAAAGILLMALDASSHGRRRARYRLALFFALVGGIAGLLGWGVRLERVTGSRQGRILTIHYPPFASLVRSSVRSTEPPGEVPRSSTLAIIDAHPIDVTGQRLASPVVPRLGALGAHLDVAGAVVEGGQAHLAFGYRVEGPSGLTLANQPLPSTPEGVTPIAAPYGTAGYHVLVWPGASALAGRYTIHLVAWDATAAIRRTADVVLDYEWTAPPAGVLASSLVFTQPDHVDRVQPEMAYAVGDAVEANAVVRCAAASDPVTACSIGIRTTLEPLAPTPGHVRTETLPPAVCNADAHGLCTISLYLQGLAVGRYHLVVALDEPKGAERSTLTGDFIVLPPDKAPPRDLAPASGATLLP